MLLVKMIEARHQPWHEPKIIQSPDCVAKFEKVVDRLIAYASLAVMTVFGVDYLIQPHSEAQN